MPVRRLCIVLAAAVAALPLGSAPLTAQRAAPSNVTVTEMKGAVSVSWRSIKDASVSYRVLRGADPRKMDTDLTRPLPYDITSYLDGQMPATATAFYAVVAVYGDGTESASLPVQYIPATTTAAPSPRGMTAGPLTMAPPLALRATPVTSTGFSTVTLYWPAVVTTVPEPVSYQVRLLKLDPATQPPGGPIGFLSGPSPKLDSNGRMTIVDYSADMERPTWYSVVATSTTQGSVAFPWYRRDPPPHHGVDTITGAYWPLGAMASRHWVGCFMVSDVPGAAMYSGHIRVGTSPWAPIGAPATHLAHFDTNMPGFQGIRQQLDAGGVMQIQMWPVYSTSSSAPQFVADTAHVQQVVQNVQQVATPWDLSKCAP
jgi:hypothetical protein